MGNIPTSTGCIWFLNTVFSYHRFIETGKLQGTLKFKYHHYFGNERQVQPSSKFPLLISDKPVFIIQSDEFNCGFAMLLHMMDFYIYQTSLECYNNGSKFTMTQKMWSFWVIQNLYLEDYGGSNFDEASLVDASSESSSAEEILTRETLQIEFFRKLLSQFRREMIQCFDSLSTAYFPVSYTHLTLPTIYSV